ncbi:MAG: hypothetical protein LBJ00_00420 [Planctomycetaceae bacterium]|jgi:hypothetical protein|nr:hypothetical protein [Planctomycetaceae bacterium]
MFPKILKAEKPTKKAPRLQQKLLAVVFYTVAAGFAHTGFSTNSGNRHCSKQIAHRPFGGQLYGTDKTRQPVLSTQNHSKTKISYLSFSDPDIP